MRTWISHFPATWRHGRRECVEAGGAARFTGRMEDTKWKMQNDKCKIENRISENIRFIIDDGRITTDEELMLQVPILFAGFANAPLLWAGGGLRTGHSSSAESP